MRANQVCVVGELMSILFVSETFRQRMEGAGHNGFFNRPKQN